MLLPALLVGYNEPRYYAPPLLILYIVLFALLMSMTAEAWGPGRAAMLLLLAVLPLGPMLLLPLQHRDHLFSPRAVMAPLSPTPEMQQVTDAVHSDSKGQPHCLNVNGRPQDFLSTGYGALTGEPTSMMPNLVGGTFADYVRDWHITHLYDAKHNLAAIDTTGTELIPLDVPGLYRIRLTSPRSTQ